MRRITDASELRRISSALLGTVDIVADAADLATDFRTIMGAALGKGVGDVALLRTFYLEKIGADMTRQREIAASAAYKEGDTAPR